MSQSLKVRPLLFHSDARSTLIALFCGQNEDDLPFITMHSCEYVIPDLQVAIRSDCCRYNHGPGAGPRFGGSTTTEASAQKQGH
jgi:hypothetical protein